MMGFARIDHHGHGGAEAPPWPFRFISGRLITDKRSLTKPHTPGFAPF
jgi:hypothetical protein